MQQLSAVGALTITTSAKPQCTIDVQPRGCTSSKWKNEDLNPESILWTFLFYVGWKGGKTQGAEAWRQERARLAWCLKRLRGVGQLSGSLPSCLTLSSQPPPVRDGVVVQYLPHVRKVHINTVGRVPGTCSWWRAACLLLTLYPVSLGGLSLMPAAGPTMDRADLQMEIQMIKPTTFLLVESPTISHFFQVHPQPSP